MGATVRVPVCVCVLLVAVFSDLQKIASSSSSPCPLWQLFAPATLHGRSNAHVHTHATRVTVSPTALLPFFPRRKGVKEGSQVAGRDDEEEAGGENGRRVRWRTRRELPIVREEGCHVQHRCLPEDLLVRSTLQIKPLSTPMMRRPLWSPSVLFSASVTDTSGNPRAACVRTGADV